MEREILKGRVEFNDQKVILEKKVKKKEKKKEQYYMMVTILEKLLNEIMKNAKEIFKPNFVELFSLDPVNTEIVDKIIDRINNYLKQREKEKDLSEFIPPENEFNADTNNNSNIEILELFGKELEKGEVTISSSFFFKLIQLNH